MFANPDYVGFVQNEFLVFGGRTQNGPTERIHTLRPGYFAPKDETLPVPLYGHCVVTVHPISDPNSSKVYIIGGYHGRVDENNGISSDVWLMDYSKQPPETVLLNSLRTPRMEHMCGLIVEVAESGVETWKIIVAGGFDGTNSLNSIEIFDIQDNTDYNQWRYSASSLNQSLHGGAMVSDFPEYYELAIIGGKSIGRGFSNKATRLTWDSAKSDLDVKDDEHNTLNYVRADFALIEFRTICPTNPTTPKPTSEPTEAPTEAPTNAPTNPTVDPTPEGTTELP